jgi:hypothetical protein
MIYKRILQFILLVISFQLSAQNTPKFPQGDGALSALLSDQMKKNTAPNSKLITYHFTVSFDVRVDSSITNITIIKGVNQILDDKFTKVLSKVKFVPAIQNGSRMKMNLMMNIPVTF